VITRQARFNSVVLKRLLESVATRPKGSGSEKNTKFAPFRSCIGCVSASVKRFFGSL
jgi:hypothetical protein